MKMQSNSSHRRQVGHSNQDPSKEWFASTARRMCAIDQDQNQLALSVNQQLMSDTNTMLEYWILSLLEHNYCTPSISNHHSTRARRSVVNLLSPKLQGLKKATEPETSRAGIESSRLQVGHSRYYPSNTQHLPR